MGSFCRRSPGHVMWEWHVVRSPGCCRSHLPGAAIPEVSLDMDVDLDLFASKLEFDSIFRPPFNSFYIYSQHV